MNMTWCVGEKLNVGMNIAMVFTRAHYNTRLEIKLKVTNLNDPLRFNLTIYEVASNKLAERETTKYTFQIHLEVWYEVVRVVPHDDMHGES